MFLDKRGDKQYDLTITLIALIIVALILISSGTGLFGVLSEKADIGNCNTWIGLQSKFKVEGVRLIPRDNPCATNVNTLEDKKDLEVYEYFAKKSFSCWDMYGRGKVDFFSDWDLTGIENYCFVCDEAVIGKGVKINEFDLDNFEVFLSNNKPRGEKKSYSDLFIEAENSRIDFGEGKIDLNIGDKVYTMYVVTKTDEAPTVTDRAVDTFYMTGENVIKSVAFSRAVTESFAGTKQAAVMGLAYSGVQATFGANYMYPSLVIANGGDVVDGGKVLCSDVHFNPKKRILK